MCNSITQIFGSGVAYGASFTNGKFASWRIFFLIIGLITILIGFCVFSFLPDSPVKALRFTETERVAALLRVKENLSGTQNATLKKAQVLESLKDVRVWLVFLSVLLTSIPNGMCFIVIGEACLDISTDVLQVVYPTSRLSCLRPLATPANKH